MTWKSNEHRYGRMALLLHWLTAALILTLLILGFQLEDMANFKEKILFLRIHAGAGIIVLLLTLFRLVWWRWVDQKPLMPHAMPRGQTLATRLVHALLYINIFVIAGSGIAMLALSGVGNTLFSGEGGGPLPDFEMLSPQPAHAVGVIVLIALMAIHVAAAFYHHFILRDGIFARMGIGRR